MNVRRFLRGLFGRTEGIASLEFVLILVPMITIFFGMIQWGIMLYNYNHMENVARETARKLAVDDDINPASDGTLVSCGGLTPLSGEEYACDLLDLPSTGTEVSACYEQDQVPPQAIFRAIVTIEAPMDDLGMIDIFGIGENKTLSTTADMRVENGKIALANGEPYPCLCGGGAPDFGITPAVDCGP